MYKRVFYTIGTIALIVAVGSFWLGTETPTPASADTGGPTGAGGGTSDTTVCSDNMSWGAVTTELQSNDTAYIAYTGKSFDLNDISDGLVANTFGFTTSGTIDGIQVEVINWTQAGGAQYEDVILMAGGSRVGADKEDSSVAIPTADPSSTYKSWGGSADTWSAGLTSTQVNAADFGVQLCYQATSNDTEINIDHVRITVTYTPATGEPQVQQSVYWFE